MAYAFARSIGRAVTIACLAAGSSAATGDDTELYVGLAAGQDRVNPNVLFVIDTSGSMDSEVVQTSPYDPGAYYVPGSDGQCSNDDLVFFDDNGPPDCSDWRQRFDREKLVCQHALDKLYGDRGAAITGFYSDQFAAWQTRWDEDDERWRNDGFHRANRQYVECEDDAGEHGATTGGAAWPRNGRSGPWVSTPPLRDIWNRWDNTTLYSAHYLRWYHFHRVVGSSTRLEVVQAVTKDIVDSVSGINAGLMRFDRTTGDLNPTFYQWDYYQDRWTNEDDSQGGYVVFPLSDVDQPGVKDDFKSTVDALTSTGFTPLAETLYEAMLYYRGQRVRFGHEDNGEWSHASSREGDRYISPITHSCGSNYIVFLSDGIANSDNGVDEQIEERLATTNLVDRSCENGDYFTSDVPYDNCLDELAEYMFTTDSATAAYGNDLDDIQNIVTYTVGFNIDEGKELLVDAARKSKADYYDASSAQELAKAFTRIIERILRINSTFTSPAVSINAFNRLAHREEMFFTVFRPDDRPHWDGNVKKYRFSEVLDANGNPVDADNDGETDFALVDADGNPAIDPQTGYFSESSRSLWSPDDFSPDGDEVRAGGLASRLFDYDGIEGRHESDTREGSVFTLTGDPSNPGGNLIRDLTHGDNRLHEDNARTADNPSGKLTRDMFGVPGFDDEQFTRLVKWARGVDVDDENENGLVDDGRPVLGASLHTKPYLLTYRADENTGQQDDYLFVFTNDGYLHMAATGDGTPAGTSTARLESWTFIPPDKLTNLKTLYDDDEASNITYGIDGGVDAWFNDANGDHDLLDDGLAVDAGDHAYLYFGQRRGGRNYYALDVSDPDSPAFLWSATGDDTRSATTMLEKLGQTWSRPRHTRIYDTSGDSLFVRDVVIFGGGYDVAQDTPGARSADTVGNAVYILDATTGALLWWAGDGAGAAGAVPDLLLADMRYSIPADIRIIDVNGDGVMDRFYTADTGGQVWRFDILNDESLPLDERILGGRIADLQLAGPGSAETAQNSRRFYYPPDVALIRPATGRPFHSVAIGSGYRAHPNDKSIDDRIYVLKDYAIQGPPRSSDGVIAYRTRYEDDLLDVTELIDFSNVTDAQAERLQDGWFISLRPGEKVLSGAVTMDGRILFTSYVPADENADDPRNVCAPGQGSGWIHALDAETGAPVANLDGSADPDIGGSIDYARTDRFKRLNSNGIPPEVTLVFPDPEKSSPIPVVGTEPVPELKMDNAPRKTYWYQDNVH